MYIDILDADEAAAHKSCKWQEQEREVSSSSRWSNARLSSSGFNLASLIGSDRGGHIQLYELLISQGTSKRNLVWPVDGTPSRCNRNHLTEKETCIRRSAGSHKIQAGQRLEFPTLVFFNFPFQMYLFQFPLVMTTLSVIFNLCYVISC